MNEHCWVKLIFRCRILMGSLIWFGAIIVGVQSISNLAYAEPLFDYPRESNFVVIEYTLIDHMISGADSIPLLRIFGDGRVAIHFPVYMKRAGDYEMRLSDLQLQQLLKSLDQKSVLGLKSNQVTQLKKQAETLRLSQSGTVIERSDDTYSVIKINLGTYAPSTTAAAITGFKQSVKIENLNWSAKMYPEVQQLKNAAAAEQELKALLNHPNLKKIN